MIHLFLFFFHTLCWCVMSECFYPDGSCRYSDPRYSKMIPSSRDCGSDEYSAMYIPTPTINYRWFIEERLKDNSPLFKKYAELGNHTILSYLEKTNDFPDLKEKLVLKQKSQIIDYKRMIYEGKAPANPLNSLPAELQFTIFQYAYPKMFSKDITLNDYRNATTIETEKKN